MISAVAPDMFDRMRWTNVGIASSIVASAVAAACVPACVGDNTSTTDNASDAGDGSPTPESSAPESGASTDAASDAAEAVDAGTDAPAPPCNVGKPFNAATLVPGAGLNTSTASEYNPRVLPDELTIYFVSDRVDAGGAGSADLYFSSRTSRTGAFDVAMPVAGANSPQNDYDPRPSADQLTLIFASDRPVGTFIGDIYVATRGSSNSPFGGITALTAVNSASSEGDPFVRLDVSELWFASDRPAGQGQEDIYRAPAGAGGGPYANPVAVAELNSSASDKMPVITTDGLTVFWSSTRTDGNAKGGYDIWTASRSTPTGTFSAPTNVAELNTGQQDEVGAISTDGCRIYFASNQPSSMGFDVYVAERPAQ
jgi:Tol biopolymer transport system component